MDTSHLRRQAYSESKHMLVLVDSNVEHRAQVVTSLMSLYNIVEFDSGLAAVKYIRDMQPDIVLIGEEVAPRGGFEMVRDLRSHRKTKSLPILLILSSGHSSSPASARECGASGWLVKPYRRSDLIRLISRQFNASVEARWDVLPQVQVKALKSTVEIFDNLSDIIGKGESIAYMDANDACAPLVEAVNSGDFKGMLGGVRDHDNYTYAHSLRVAVFLSLFGKAIGLSLDDQKQLATGGLLQDVGKMFIPHLVLNKAGKLTDEEFDIMKGHVDATTRILETGGNIPRGVITITSQHHEKIDGTGYPRGLKGAQLNELARMASIVDVFSALTDRRVYRPPVTPEKALSIMFAEMKGHLDLDLLGRFREMLLDAAADTMM